MTFRSSCLRSSFCVLVALSLQRDVFAIEPGRAAAHVPQHVAQDGAHATVFGDGFAHTWHGEDAVASGDVAASSFAGVDARAGADVVTLRPSAETAADIERAAAALKDARSSKRVASTMAYDADWQRLLDGEKRAISKLLRAELLLSKAGVRSL